MSLEDELLRQRWARIREIESMGYRAYGKRYDFTHAIPQILAEYSPKTATQLAQEYPIISADSHLQVASEHWTGHVPAQYRELAPRTVRVRELQDGTVKA